MLNGAFASLARTLGDERHDGLELLSKFADDGRSGHNAHLRNGVTPRAKRRSLMRQPWVAIALIVGVQLIDVAVHVAVDQVEPVRVLSNLVLVGSMGAAVGYNPGIVGGLTASDTPVGRLALVAMGSLVYLALNVWFVYEQGWVNPATERLRLPLFGFVGISLALVAWLWAARPHALD